MTEPNSAFEAKLRDFKAAALNAGARDMEATVNPAYDSANVQLHYDLMNAAEKALLDAYAGTAIDELIRNYKLAVITRHIRCGYQSGASEYFKRLARDEEEAAEAALRLAFTESPDRPRNVQI